MAIFTTLSVVIWFSTGTLGIFATLVYAFTMRMVIYDILSMAIIPTLSTSIPFCNLCYILLWISPRSVVKIAIRIQRIVQHWYTQKKINTQCGDFYHTIGPDGFELILLKGMGKIAKGINKINFTMLYGNYCYIIIENFPQKFSPRSG